MERTFSKLGGGKKDNMQWYYIDKDNNYVGPVNTHKMRQLKKFDYVTLESYVWASHLSGWKTFAQIPELVESKAGAGPGGGKPGGAKVGAPPSLGMASAKVGAPPSIGMAKPLSTSIAEPPSRELHCREQGYNNTHNNHCNGVAESKLTP